MGAVPAFGVGAPNPRGDRRQGGLGPGRRDQRLTRQQLGQPSPDVLGLGEAHEPNAALDLVCTDVLTDGASEEIQDVVRARGTYIDDKGIARSAQRGE